MAHSPWGPLVLAQGALLLFVFRADFLRCPEHLADRVARAPRSEGKGGIAFMWSLSPEFEPLMEQHLCTQSFYNQQVGRVFL
jgi:hypothetical protein